MSEPAEKIRIWRSPDGLEFKLGYIGQSPFPDPEILAWSLKTGLVPSLYITRAELLERYPKP